MIKFYYKAKKGLSEVYEDFIEAENQQDALNKLIQQGLFPVSISDTSPVKEGRKNKKSAQKIKKKNKKITSSEVLIFTQKLCTLIRAKVELLSSLRIIYEQTDNLRFQEIIYALYNSTKEGKPFSESLENYPRVFSSLFINIVKSGEASGRLDLALEQISEFLYRQESLKTKIAVAMAYPLLLLFVGLVSIFVLITFVIPKLRPIFEGLGTKLPLITRIILKISLISNKGWWLVLGAILIFGFVLYSTKGSVYFKNLIRKALGYVPLLKRLARNQELDNFSRSLSLLLKSGVPALRSLEIATLSLTDPKLKSELKNVCKDVSSGSSISKCMAESSSLPDFFNKMLAVGEESGRIAEVLDEISRSYAQQMEADMAMVTSLLEPALILVLGLVLGTIVLSILLPTFQITQLVH